MLVEKGTNLRSKNVDCKTINIAVIYLLSSSTSFLEISSKKSEFKSARTFIFSISVTIINVYITAAFAEEFMNTLSLNVNGLRHFCLFFTQEFKLYYFISS